VLWTEVGRGFEIGILDWLPCRIDDSALTFPVPFPSELSGEDNEYHYQDAGEDGHGKPKVIGVDLLHEGFHYRLQSDCMR
jgi:hypothetical protein